MSGLWDLDLEPPEDVMYVERLHSGFICISLKIVMDPRLGKKLPGRGKRTVDRAPKKVKL